MRALFVLLFVALAVSTSHAQGHRELPSLSTLDSLRVSYQDGRPRQSFSLAHRAEGDFIDLADLGRALGEGFSWDPESYRGSISFDSVSVGFVLDSPLFWTSGRVVQAAPPVRYQDERVWMPLSFIESVVLPRMKTRARWDRATGSLLIVGQGPWLESVEVHSNAGRLVVTLTPIAEPMQHRVRWDPSGTLSIEVEGLALSPNFEAPSGRVADLGRLRVTPRPKGVTVQLSLDPVWVGVRTRRTGNTLTAELTRSRRDLEGLGFEALNIYPESRGRQRVGQPRRILLEVGSGGDAAGAQYLQNLAAAMENALTMDFGHEVLRIPDREAEGRGSSPKNRPEIPSLPEADCWIGLRLERYPSTSEPAFVFVCPSAPTHWNGLNAMVGVRAEQTDAEVSESERRSSAYNTTTPLTGVQPAPWGAAVRNYQGASSSLAQTLADHLGVEMGSRRLTVLSRPARIFRGMSMPAVLLYPLSLGDADGVAALSDRDLLERTARSLAFGLDEFLLAHPGEN